MRTSNERGVALIMAMTLILIMSVMAISLSFIARGETWSSMNYRLMSQARDAAEAGVNKASNYLMYTYSVPGPVGSDPITGVYDVTVSPVTSGGNPVVLSADGSVSSNYPVSSVDSAFGSAGSGSMAAGTTTVDYAASARLLFMRKLDDLPPYLTTGGNNTVQTWEITSTGSVDGVQPASVSVVAKLERRIVPVFAYAAFATDPYCDALDFGGGGTTNSYNSAVQNVDPSTMYSGLGGNVGTNGGLSTVGATTNIGGSLSTPRLGVGNCTNSTVTALDGSLATVDDGIIQLPTAISYPTPVIPAPGTTDLDSGSCPAGVSGCTTVAAGYVTGGAAGVKLDAAAAGGTINLQNVTMTGGKDLYLTAGTYNINTISQQGSTVLHILSGPVYINVTGNGVNSNQDAIKLTGGGISNPGTGGYPPNPSMLQFAYAGTANVKIAGSSAGACLVYAPNASASITGGSDFYGSIVANKIKDFGGANIHYDRKLETTVLKAGSYTLDSFNWKKF